MILFRRVAAEERIVIKGLCAQASMRHSMGAGGNNFAGE